MIQTRRSSDKTEERHDLFSNLLDASEDANHSVDGAKMTDSELSGRCSCLLFLFKLLTPSSGNIFIFLLAGHEVSGTWGDINRAADIYPS